jgi:hypothetical protein
MMTEDDDGPLRIREVFKILSDDVAEPHYLHNTYQFLVNSDHFAKIFESTAPICLTAARRRITLRTRRCIKWSICSPGWPSNDWTYPQQIDDVAARQ